ncbi:LacI family DNA-binding transcriptional regulator [Novosphingobium terrae]|uniref:LacI family DNA-binding transcriptional regulator n=1 Tax=Novosphingobium terrae TaxID=2726189 RepID=UPI0019817CAE|nr:LacI family DNA-binding transcriptional regulator [Novosphingobium terrae]
MPQNAAPPMSATMGDVAQKAGVSLKSVSRVINNEPHVSAKLRARVQAAIDALDYVPDTAARSLAGGRNFIISVMFDNPSPNYIIKVLSGTYRACVEHQYHLRIDQFDGATGTVCILAQLEQVLRHSRVDGFVLTPPLCDDRRILDRLDAQGLRYVRVAPTVDPGRSAAVQIDDAAAAATVADMFWRHGHRHIGLINGPELHGAAGRRRQGFLERLHTLAPDLEVSEAEGAFTFEGGMSAGGDLLDRVPGLTAIFAANDDSAAGAMTACRQRGLDVPGQISVCGFDDSPVASSVWPYLTTVYQPIEEMAYTAVNLLLARGDADALAQSTLDYRLIERQSVALASHDEQA